MATKKELFNQELTGYWENPDSNHIYMLYGGAVIDDNPRTHERIHWNAEAINLRTGKEIYLHLRDFLKLKKLDAETTAFLDEHINPSYLAQSIHDSYRQTLYPFSRKDTHPEADLLAHIIAETPLNSPEQSRHLDNSDSVAVHPSDPRASRRNIQNIFGKQVSSFSP